MNDRELLDRLDAGLGAEIDLLPDHVFRHVMSSLPSARQARSLRWSRMSLFAAAIGASAVLAVVAIAVMTGVVGPFNVGSPGPAPGSDVLVIVARAGGSANLALVVVDTGEVIPLTANQSDSIQPDWSPEGRAVAFVRDGDLYTIDVNSRHTRQLTSTDGIVEERPAWSPSGERIAFSTVIGSESTIWTMPSDGGERQPVITFDGAFACCPSWAPDGARMVVGVDYSSGGEIDLFVVDVAAGTAAPITDAPGDDSSAKWSPDGAHIAFQADQEAGLMVMRPDGTQRQLVQPSLAQGFGIGWSPDSRRIAWVQDGVIHVTGVDGLDEVQLDLNLKGSVEDVAWRP